MPTLLSLAGISDPSKVILTLDQQGRSVIAWTAQSHLRAHYFGAFVLYVLFGCSFFGFNKRNLKRRRK